MSTQHTDFIYLSHCAISPPRQVAAIALQQALAEVSEKGILALPARIAEEQRIKAKLAELSHSHPDDFALTSGTTAAIELVALNRLWKTNDHIVCFHGEFPANVLTWQSIAREQGLTFELQDAWAFITDPQAALTRLERYLARAAAQGQSGLVAISAVQFQSGLRMPLQSISESCHRHGFQVFVDVIQAFGVIPLDFNALGIDYAGSGGHKWLRATDGTGFLYVATHAKTSLTVRTGGWLGTTSPIDFLSQPNQLAYDKDWAPIPQTFERSSHNSLGCAAMCASLKTLTLDKLTAIYQHIQAYHDALEASLIALGFISLRSKSPDERSGILAIKPPKQFDFQRFISETQARGLILSCPDGVIRIAPHEDNPISEVPHVLAIIAASLDAALHTK